MKKIGIFWGSNTNNTRKSAFFMKNHLESQGVQVDIFDVSEISIDTLLEYENILIGCSTWHQGELQRDWDMFFVQFSQADFRGVTGAFFGCGDQRGHTSTFIDAVGILAKSFVQNGGRLIGRCDPREYSFESSLAYDHDAMLGLALDYTNYEERCEIQMLNWLDSIYFDFWDIYYEYV